MPAARGVLLGTEYPHGIRFTGDGRFIVVADAGAPVVNAYRAEDDDWSGSRDFVVTTQIMSEETFLRGRINPEEGGPKGIDIDRGMNVLAVTSECKPLAFFDLPVVLGAA